jgi:isopenicillin-N epimerase
VDPAQLEAFGLDPDVLHLNHGAYGVAPVAVRRAAAAWRERAERNPHRFNRVEAGPLVAAARERAAAFLGVDPSRAAWVRNVSEGVSAVLSSLALRPGDELLTSTHGYGAVRMALRHHAARAGARVTEAAFAVGAADDEVVSAYASACSSRTRLVVIDRITSPTATVLPVAAVAAATRKGATGAGARVLVDAAHAPGQLADDIAALGADHWVGNLHKWAYTPRGSAILWSRPGLDVTPGVLSWRLEDGYAESFDYPGTWDYAGWLAASDGLAYWEALGGWDRVAQLARLVTEGQEKVAAALGARDAAGAAAGRRRRLTRPGRRCLRAAVAPAGRGRAGALRRGRLPADRGRALQHARRLWPAGRRGAGTAGPKTMRPNGSG